MSGGLINPANDKPLQRQGNTLADGNGASFPIIGGIPRICEPSNYADSFGKQWNRFRLTQLDAEGQALSRQRFFAETGWSSDQLAGADVLEHTSANLYSIDYSKAVEANFANNASFAHNRLHLFQASIYDLPFADGTFDKVFCFGVLQHTPSFE